MSDRIRAIHGDSREVLKTLADGSVDSCVCDPPYSLVTIGKRFGGPNARLPNNGHEMANPYNRVARGFMGSAWDNGTTAFDPEFWREVYRVLKPGAHVVAFGGTRTFHRLVCAIEDAGFEVRDQIAWIFGSGFPKSHDVSKGIDRAAGADREVIATEKVRDIRNGGGRGLGEGINAAERSGPVYMQREITAPATDAARDWQGWGTGLKPALEPICLARKPLVRTVAENVLEHGTGVINVDGCRVQFVSEADQRAAAAAAAEQRSRQSADRSYEGWGMRQQNLTAAEYAAGPGGKGRWPANVIHDGSEEVVGAFPESDGQQGDVRGTEPSGVTADIYGKFSGRVPAAARNDCGSASRFFYTAKADQDDRIGSKHPTVKPIDLMQYLIRLVTPKGGLVLDPFAGTGTTGEAAFREGMRAILIEREAQYFADIERRIKLLRAGPDERQRESMKASGKTENPGPLFEGSWGNQVGKFGQGGMSVRVITGDVRELDAYCVQRLCSGISRLHRGRKFGGTMRRSSVPPTTAYLGGLALGFDRSKRQAIYRLLSLDPQVWQQRLDARNRALVGSSPRIQHFAALGTRLGHVKRPAKMVSQHRRYRRRDLSQGNSLTEHRGGSITNDAHSICAALNPYRPIAINCAGQIGQIQSLTHVSRPHLRGWRDYRQSVGGTKGGC